MTNKEIKENIFPIYKKLLEENSFEDICTFSFQWGKSYPFDPSSGLLFVGKAVNGWMTKETDVARLFDTGNPERIFARHDQMEWVNNLSEKTNGYNSRKSAFWRLIKKVSEAYYPEEWYSNIAWTNLYKVAPWKGGNPSGKLQNTQRKYCFDILQKEIEILSPQYVVFLTSGWECPFIKHLNGSEKLNVIDEKIWGGYKSTLTEVNRTKFIISRHPQGKNEWNHRSAIVELINDNETQNANRADGLVYR
jgi:hypothetical protein